MSKFEPKENKGFWTKTMDDFKSKTNEELMEIMRNSIDNSYVPKVGVGVMILKNGKILLGKRRGSHGEGEFAFPGGHLEYMESFSGCAQREVAEECGIEIENIRFQFFANVIKYAPKHYVHVGLSADWKSGEPKVLEPNKSESWSWYGVNNLPLPIFEMCKLAIESYKSGKIYFDVSD